MTCNPARSKQTPIAAVLALLAAGCGDGMDVRLGIKREFPVLPDAGTGDAPPDNTAPPDGGPDASDSSPTCANGPNVDPAFAAFLGECEGSGCPAIGGRDGCLYEVTTNSDDGPGSLREGLALAEPAWITFSNDVVDIVLRSNLEPRSHKTIDGRGRTVSIRDFGIRVVDQQNVVIANVSFIGRLDLDDDGGLDADDADAISLVGPGTHNIWIDHCNFVSYHDGLIDISDGATNVTVSRSHFSNHDNVMVFGKNIADTAAVNMRVTLYRNWFEKTRRFHPRIRYGWVHMYNNLLDEWIDFGVRAVQHSRLYSEKNIYRAELDGDPEAVTFTRTPDDDADGYVRTAGDDLVVNDAVIASNDDGARVTLPDYLYNPVIADAEGLLETSIRAEAGAHP